VAESGIWRREWDSPPLCPKRLITHLCGLRQGAGPGLWTTRPVHGAGQHARRAGAPKGRPDASRHAPDSTRRNVRISHSGPARPGRPVRPQRAEALLAHHRSGNGQAPGLGCGPAGPPPVRPRATGCDAGTRRHRGADPGVLRRATGGRPSRANRLRPQCAAGLRRLSRGLGRRGRTAAGPAGLRRPRRDPRPGAAAAGTPRHRAVHRQPWLRAGLRVFLLRAELEVALRGAERNGGTFYGEPADPLFRGVDPTAAAIGGANGHVVPAAAALPPGSSWRSTGTSTPSSAEVAASSARTAAPWAAAGPRAGDRPAGLRRHAELAPSDFVELVIAEREFDKNRILVSPDGSVRRLGKS